MGNSKFGSIINLFAGLMGLDTRAELRKEIADMSSHSCGYRVAFEKNTNKIDILRLGDLKIERVTL